MATRHGDIVRLEDGRIVDLGQMKRNELWTPPYDCRFHSQQNTKYCWQNLVDYARCMNARGKPKEDEITPCMYFFRSYRALCPAHMREKFEEQLTDGAFPVKRTAVQLDIASED